MENRDKVFKFIPNKKVLLWDAFSAGGAPFLISIFIFGSLQVFFIGVLDEYVGLINTRTRRGSQVVEPKRVNF